MMRLTGKQTWVFQHKLFVNKTATVVGPKEAKGPLKETFDAHFDDMYCGAPSWELAERNLMEQAISCCLKKAELKEEDIDLFLAGDLLNQNATSNYTARMLNIPLLCMYGACSTSMETVATACALIDGGFANKIIAATSSHYGAAEKQFRHPTNFGGQKPETATTTVTGAGAVLISKDESEIAITAATIGKVIDVGRKNPYDMGSAMAPAAADTIKQHFRDLNRTPSDYDLILTGDLSGVGSPKLKELLLEDGYDIRGNHSDCGLLIFHPAQRAFAGGSGCACSAVVTYGHIFQEMKKGNLKRVLMVATGALLSKTMIKLNESIPAIAHGVVFERQR